MNWLKSSRSTNNGACVEVAWHKASFSHQRDHCVEAGPGTCGMVHVRDSKDPSGPVLEFTPAQWGGFLAGVLNHEFDLP